MKKKASTARAKATSARRRDPFKLRDAQEAGHRREATVHVYGKKVVCGTEKRGTATPRGRSPFEIVLDASAGFIPLWAKNTTLRWRFQERSMASFADPDAAKKALRALLGEAVLKWEDAAPIKFAEREENWDFEIVVSNADDCDINGCVLASAFFPDAGRHELLIYPKMLEQSQKEQVETLIHEIGHVFGLRHFFAQLSEGAWPSEIFGVHKRFTIMNYGSDSVLTPDDRSDLKRLYQAAWSGELTEVNGTEIRLVRAFSTSGLSPMISARRPTAPPLVPHSIRDELVRQAIQREELREEREALRGANGIGANGAR